MPERRRAAGDADIEAASRLLLARAPTLGRVRLGVVDGPSGSGKSTFAAAWADLLSGTFGCSVRVFSSDLMATWADPFGWWERFDRGVLTPLAGGRPGRIQLTDWSGDQPGPGAWRTIPVPEILIMEGVSCGRSALGDRCGVLVWVEVPDPVARLARSVGRDGEQARRWLTAWQDDEERFFAADRTRERADLIIRPPHFPTPVCHADPG